MVNFWRAIQADPAAVARETDLPTFESEFHARSAELLARRAELTARLEGDPRFYDAEIAGWWMWGMNLAMAGKFAQEGGPWVRREGKLLRVEDKQADEIGISRAMPRVGGMRAPISEAGMRQWFFTLQKRFQRVRVMCGDWHRLVASPSMLFTRQELPTGILLDPPYVREGRADVYAVEDDVAHHCREWAIANGDNPQLKIAYCGYEGLDFPATWEAYRWEANGGYGNQAHGQGRINKTRECIWFSPACQTDQQMRMF